MAAPARRLATHQDLSALPPNQVGEIVDGELFASPRPSARHAVASSRLGGDLMGPFDRGRGGPGGWWILDEPELHLGADVLVPDLAGWRRERMAVVPDVAAFDLAPDWICEVLSPATARLDRTIKLAVYARAGVTHAWLLDPGARTLEILRNEGGRWLLVGAFGGTEKVRGEPFAAVEIDLAGLWGDAP